MNKTNIITPRKLAGFMELEPSKQIIFNEMQDKIKSVYEKFAFAPIDTPILELSEILLAKSGGEIDKEVYSFTKGDTNICMRYDLTVPLARYVSMNYPNLTFPFKRYAIGKVFRGEKPQKGRFRELIQADADIIGIDVLPIIADAECLNLADKVFEALNIKIVNHISNRNILFGYCEGLGVENQTNDILIVLDKIGKIGKENAFEQLQILGIENDIAQKLIDITSLCGPFDEILSKIEHLSQNQTFQKGVEELKEIYTYLNYYNINKENYCLDIGIIRGQNYYTGTVFEVYMPSHLEFGAVCAGGRYDNLTTYYCDKKMPGVGVSIGLTRLFDLLDKNDMLPPHRPTNIDLQIIPLGQTLNTCLNLQTFFQKELNCEVNYDERSFKSKLKEANKRQIPFVIIVGEDEVQSQIYTLKNMDTSEQFNLNREDCLNYIKKLVKT